ncbi:hypothetical protein SEVIR_5G463250v4 [Setaria viridis]
MKGCAALPWPPAAGRSPSRRLPERRHVRGVLDPRHLAHVITPRLPLAKQNKAQSVSSEVTAQWTSAHGAPPPTPISKLRWAVASGRTGKSKGPGLLAPDPTPPVPAAAMALALALPWLLARGSLLGGCEARRRRCRRV